MSSRPPIKDPRWAYAAGQRRREKQLRARKVARGNLVNRFRFERKLTAHITDAEGEPQGPWYLKFECVDFRWMDTAWTDLARYDFDLSALPEAEVNAVVTGAQILDDFLQGNPFPAAYDNADPARRWRLAVVHRWFADRYVNSDPAPKQSIYEIRVASHGQHFSSDQVGLWCVLTIRLVPGAQNWDPADGMFLDLGDQQKMEDPEPAALLSMQILDEPWQGRLQAVHFPAPEGVEVELVEEEEDGF